jgi:hypothetical protein
MVIVSTRGATWALLRYMADHRGDGDGDIWMRLVNSDTSGLGNLRNVFGGGLMTSIRDWATSVYTGDLSVPVAAPYQQPSWNFRAMYLALPGATFPLATQSLVAGTPTVVTLDGGGAAYLRFATGTATTALVQWSAGAGQSTPAALQISLVRVQ